MNPADFVYVTLIAAPPGKVWQALTSPEFTELYWHSTRVRSDWQGLVSGGWPYVLAGLKTLLETGQAIDFSALHQ